MRHPFLDLKNVNAADLEEMSEAAARVVRSGRYLHGEETKAFEKELAASAGITDIPAIGVSNGLDALRLIFRGYMELGKLREGDEVLFPANTYIASILPITEFRLRPVAVEPNPETFNIDFKRIEEKITDRTRAIMLVHLYGNPCWDSKIMSRVRERGILVIEDNAQGIGGKASEVGFNGVRNTGALGDVAAFSFYPTKNIGAIGDAGAVLTNDHELSSAIRALGNYGSDRRYHNIYSGYNCRLDEIQAAMLRIRLRRLNEITAQRNKIAGIYSNQIHNGNLTLPGIQEGTTHVWHQYVVRHPHRENMISYLKENGVGTDIHYAVPPHLQPCYSGMDFGALPLTEQLAKEIFSLPIAGVTPAAACEIADIINRGGDC